RVRLPVQRPTSPRCSRSPASGLHRRAPAPPPPRSLHLPDEDSTARPTPAPARNPPTAGAAPRRAAIAWDTIGEKRASTPMIEAHGLTKRYGDKLAVDNVSFTEIGRASCRERVIGRVGTGHGTG